MRAFVRRLRRLEDRMGLGPAEREFVERLQQRIAEGRKRVAAMRERLGWSGSLDDGKREDLTGLTISQIILRGRDRVAGMARAKREEEQRWLATDHGQGECTQG
jgi:hypothetical protein